MEKAKQNKDNLIMYLEFLRDTEAAKPVDEMDTDLIEACVYVLLDLQDKHVSLTPEQIQEKVRSIPFKDSSEFDEYKKAKKKKLKKKRVLFIAACIGILAALLSFITTADELDILKDKFGKITNAPFDTWFEHGEDTVVRVDGTHIYQSFNEAEKAEGINILEPEYIPGGLNVEYINFYNNENDKRICDIFFTDVGVSFAITTNSIITDDIKSYTYKEKVGEFDCFFVEMHDVNLVQVYFEHDGNLYDITYNDKEELVKIIENLKE